MADSCSTAVEHMPHKKEGMGLNPARCWAPPFFFYLFLLSFDLNQAPHLYLTACSESNKQWMPSCAAWGETASISSDWVNNLSKVAQRTPADLSGSSLVGDDVDLFVGVGRRDVDHQGVPEVIAAMLDHPHRRVLAVNDKITTGTNKRPLMKMAQGTMVLVIENFCSTNLRKIQPIANTMKQVSLLM